MASQFEKRRAKTLDQVTEEIQEKRSEIRTKSEPVYTQKALDIYSPDGNGSFQVVEISYNPETGDAKVNEVFNISRMVGLSYKNHKDALATLKKKK